MPRPGCIIFLHGASSSGKSTLARGVQAEIGQPFWHISIDHLRDAGVLPRERYKRGDFDWKADRQAFFDGFHNSLVAYAAAGNNLILEHILEADSWLQELADLFVPFDVYFVGVHCSLEVLEQREAARGDRPIGSAAQDFHTIHKGVVYDLEVRSDGDADLAIGQIITGWSNRKTPSIFAEKANRAPS
ncbi:chloramphenicol phosphotransferase [Devosia epidermidihirudinis]|uniref:Chloramphenicol phosphotransferase n=1 Tax=Devosia epidermidihirudinis TaxID=1293439 RepID=A0A0F5QEC7_9HYPH|nr:AAA family ATPase [Devosia epidermidihirudinis]KKC39352.1 chloramphenicol phosphotransferase [Devosia epidermidihirudinis]